MLFSSFAVHFYGERSSSFPRQSTSFSAKLIHEWCELNTHAAITPASSPPLHLISQEMGEMEDGGKKILLNDTAAGISEDRQLRAVFIVIQWLFGIKKEKSQRGKQSHGVCRLLISQPLHAAYP